MDKPFKMTKNKLYEKLRKESNNKMNKKTTCGKKFLFIIRIKYLHLIVKTILKNQNTVILKRRKRKHTKVSTDQVHKY